MRTVRRLMSLWIVTLMLVGVWVWWVFASTEQYSCNLWVQEASKYADWILSLVEKWDGKIMLDELQVYTRKDIAVAVTLLKRSCCQQWLLAEDICEGQTEWPNYQPRSGFIVDHLMFVGMTKFDGDTEVCEALGLEGCDMASAELDAEPVKRREEIRKIAKDTKWYSAEQILRLYELYRWDNWGAWPDVEGNMYKWYIRMCDEIEEVSKLSFTTNTELDAKKRCEDRIKLRYEQERAYVQTLMVEKWNQYLGNMMREYLKEYFADQRLSGLVTKYGVLDACWRMVLKTVQPTKNCCN